MLSASREATVALDQLDDHLKAIVKLKLREFVHLSPWFNDVPSVDVTNYSNFAQRARLLAGEGVRFKMFERTEPAAAHLACPNRHAQRPLRRGRPLRPTIV